jgi:ABC-type phosphate/phosphonate transport system substrate-binding protein
MAQLASGSHDASMRLVAEGAADAAAIDSNVLALALRRQPATVERLRVVACWGPFPIQPVVVRSGLPAPLKRALAGALMRMHTAASMRTCLSEHGVLRFVPVSEKFYLTGRELQHDHSSACSAS